MRLYVYDNWSTYDELSDAVPLTEELALFQLGEVGRLQANGVRFDAYLMDAYWYEPSGGYKTWREDRWPDGPQRWFDACREANLLPGLWFPANTCFTLEPPATWRNSLASDGWGFCCFEGGFLEGFAEVLRYWYRQGVRVFKFDFADFGAASDETKLLMLPSEIRGRNIEAFRAMLAAFRDDCPEAYLLAYNGFDEVEFMPWTDRPVRRVIDLAWLNVFDSVYCGDPRPADLPMENFWRTLDIYADHQVRYLNLGGIPLEKIDNCALMIGRTDTCYKRGDADWRATWLLSYARGGHVHVAMGNLEAISDEDARWIAKIQALLESETPPEWMGGLPGKGEIFGYRTSKATIWVNPGREPSFVPLEGVLTYADGAWELDEHGVGLAPGGVAMMQSEGCSVDSPPPSHLSSLDLAWELDGRRATATVQAESGEIHFGFTQVDAKGLAVRTSTGSGPGIPTLGSLLRLQATVGETELGVRCSHDRVIWSGVSWAYGVVRVPEEATIQLIVESLDAAVKTIRPFAYRRAL